VTHALLTRPFAVLRVPTVILGGLLCGLAAPVQADPITLSVSGTVDRVCGPCSQQFLGFIPVAGDAFAFSVTFDPSAPRRVVDNDVFGYLFGEGSFNLSLGAEVITRAGPVTGMIRNGLGGGDIDQLLLSSGAIPLFGFSPFGKGIAVDVSGIDVIGHWLTTEAWPIDVAAVLGAAPEKFFTVVNLSGDVQNTSTFLATGTGLRFTQTSGVAPTPEPASILLLGTAFAGFAARQWRQRKREQE
jgi:hypothetical protein